MMALTFVDGFNFWTTLPGCWTSSGSSGGTPSVSGGKLTIPAVFSGTSFVRWTFPATIGTVIVNIRSAFAPKTIFQGEILFALYDGDDIQCCVVVNSAGQLAIKRGNTGGTQIGGYSAYGFVQDSATYYDIEVKINVANSGSCIIQVNGAEVLNVSGDLASTANENCNNILFGNPGGQTQTVAVIHEHVIIMNTSGTTMNDFIGPVKVSPHALTADGNYTDYTANTGDRWAAVDDANPDDATTFISANTVGQKYTAVVDNLPTGITDVHAVAVWLRARRSDDVTRAHKTLLRSASTDQLFGSHQYLGPAYAYQFAAFELSPFTAVAWTPSEVNGLEVGAQVTV